MSLIILNFYIFTTTLKSNNNTTTTQNEFMTPQPEVKAEPFVINKEYFKQKEQTTMLNDYSTGYLNLESDLYN